MATWREKPAGPVMRARKSVAMPPSRSLATSSYGPIFCPAFSTQPKASSWLDRKDTCSLGGTCFQSGRSAASASACDARELEQSAHWQRPRQGATQRGLAGGRITVAMELQRGDARRLRETLQRQPQALRVDQAKRVQHLQRAT